MKESKGKEAPVVPFHGITELSISKIENNIIQGDYKRAPNSSQIYISAGNGPLKLGVFFIFSWTEKDKIQVSANCSSCKKKLTNIK